MEWMREMTIIIFIQMELKACRDELDWLIRCHNCAADNWPEEEYPPRSPAYSFRLHRQFAEEIGQGNEGHITTHSKDDSQDVLSSTRSSAVAGNFIMLARGAVGNLIGSAAR